ASRHRSAVLRGPVGATGGRAPEVPPGDGEVSRVARTRDVEERDPRWEPMIDTGDELRELLQRKADDVPPHREIPRALEGRARRRIGLNALGVGMVVVVLAAGALAGVRAFGGPQAQQRPAGITS